MIFDRTTKTMIAVVTLVAATFVMTNHIIQNDPIEDWGIAGLLFAISVGFWTLMWREDVAEESTALALSDEAVLPRAQEWIISKDVIGELPSEVVQDTAAEAHKQVPLPEPNNDPTSEKLAEVTETAVKAAPDDSEMVEEAKNGDPVAESVIAQTQAAPPNIGVEEKAEENETILADASTNDDPVEPDDLKRIEGIGKVYEGVLNDAGITTFKQIAEMGSEQLADIIVDSGRPRPSSAQTWPEQAALAAKGDWDALATLQDNLNAGRRE